MNPFRPRILLPHEWFFGAFLLVQYLRLLVAAGPRDRDALTYLALLLANVAVIAWGGRRASPARWHVRLWFYPVVMNFVFFTMRSSVLKVSPVTCDALLGAIDERWFGAILSVRATAIAGPVLTEVMSLCYLLFFPYLVISWFTYAWRGLEIFRTFFVGLFTIYGIGFLGYSLVPAGGPHLAFSEQFGAPLSGGVITAFNARVVAAGSNGVDVFPSLHCAVSAFLLCFDRRHSPRRFRVLLVPCLGLWLATIYLRYHYFIDVIGGFALAAFGCWITHRWAEANPPKEINPGLP